MFKFIIQEVERLPQASAMILNTFDMLETDAIEELRSKFPAVYTVGPLHLLSDQFPMEGELKSIGCNLWKEDNVEYMKWLDTKEMGSVVYVNFGSITVMTAKQVIEFAWGLANSKVTFLWIIRSDLVNGESTILPAEFVTETKERSLLAGWQVGLLDRDQIHLRLELQRPENKHPPH
nr:7-deoxyloganetin glucosyltransferase-like [Ipomoea trifida]